MAKLKDKLKTALDETRMLMLGSQILLGFQFRSVFESGFERLPASSQYLKLGGLVLILTVTGLLMSPGSYHRIVARGEVRKHVITFTSRVMDLALLPFGLALAIDVYVATGKLAGKVYGAIAGLAFAITALFFWYGWELIQRSQRAAIIKEEQAMEKKQEPDSTATRTKDKIDHVLTEARVVLPGAQALLGFQFATMLMDGFDKLPLSSKYLHLSSLLLIGITVILLMTPAAYHRIVEKGEETEHFHRVASGLLLGAMVVLPLGISGDFFVVLRKVTESTSLAMVSAGLLILSFYGLWFGFTIYQRGQRSRAA